jgi:hypothetical protein
MYIKNSIATEANISMILKKKRNVHSLNQHLDLIMYYSYNKIVLKNLTFYYNPFDIFSKTQRVYHSLKNGSKL